MYSLLRSILFRLPAEAAHDLALKSLKLGLPAPISKKLQAHIPLYPVELMGLKFPNPVGLAAGLDKNADHINALAALGFGFIEVGTVTPKPQAGNPKPRLFRITEQQAIINRMGFNNKGIDYLINQVKRSSYNGIIGINIGKNKTTAPEKSIDDYLICLKKAYNYADYITINISSPNTPGLRDLHKASALNELLSELMQQRSELAKLHMKKVPLILKIAPDLNDSDLDNIAESATEHKIDGLIISNTTLERPGLENYPTHQEQGGLSGKPLLPLANDILYKLHLRLENKIPLIGVGGISSGKDALTKFEAGAALIQLYTGFIYRGPKLITEIVDAIKNRGQA